MTNNKKIRKVVSGFPIWAGYLMVAVICIGSTLLLVSNKIERQAVPKSAVAAMADEKGNGDVNQSAGGGGNGAAYGNGTGVSTSTGSDGIGAGSITGYDNGGNIDSDSIDAGGITDGNMGGNTGGNAGRNAGSVTGGTGTGLGSRGYRFADNWFMDTRIKYVMDGIWHRMGNVNEILDTAARIRHTSELSWYREWYKTAERIRAIGDDCLEKGHRISAGEAYLRASNYYLTAEVMLHTNPDDQRIAEAYKKGGEYFMKGMELLSAPVTEVWIPYEGTRLKGYFFRADTGAAAVSGTTAGTGTERAAVSGTTAGTGTGTAAVSNTVTAAEIAAEADKAPILLVHQGYDAPIESTKHIAEEAARRGYHCLLFEGPGQGLTIREQNIPLRPDWETAVSAVVDYAVTIPGVDEDNIMLMGISMGGGFAVRAAAFEPRLKLCILNPGYLNVYDIISNYLTTELMNLYEEDPRALNEKMEEIAGYDVGTRWGIYHGMWVFGAETPSRFLDNVKKFDNTAIIDKISCKVLVMDGTSELWGKGQSKELYDMLRCEKDYMLFTEEDSASEHCQVGAGGIATQRLFDWIDENLKK